jgi:hypothetical protein
MTAIGQGHDGPTVRVVVRAAAGRDVWCYRAGTWRIYAVEVGE